jgi:hypothetical protein
VAVVRWWQARRAVRDAVIMSIAYCYHSRLPRDERAELRERLTDAWVGDAPI